MKVIFIIGMVTTNASTQEVGVGGRQSGEGTIEPLLRLWSRRGGHSRVIVVVGGCGRSGCRGRGAVHPPADDTAVECLQPVFFEQVLHAVLKHFLDEAVAVGEAVVEVVVMTVVVVVVMVVMVVSRVVVIVVLTSPALLHAPHHHHIVPRGQPRQSVQESGRLHFPVHYPIDTPVQPLHAVDRRRRSRGRAPGNFAASLHTPAHAAQGIIPRPWAFVLPRAFLGMPDCRDETATAVREVHMMAVSELLMLVPRASSFFGKGTPRVHAPCQRGGRRGRRRVGGSGVWRAIFVRRRVNFLAATSRGVAAAHQLITVVTTLPPHPHARPIIGRHAHQVPCMARRRGRRRRAGNPWRGRRGVGGMRTEIVEVVRTGRRGIGQGRTRRRHTPLPSHSTASLGRTNRRREHSVLIPPPPRCC